MAASLLSTAIFLMIMAVCLIITRLTQILPPRSRPYTSSDSNKKDIPHLLVILGSGGHTTEMLSMLERATTTTSDPAVYLDWSRIKHRTWVIGSGDGLGASRAKQFEESAAQRLAGPQDTGSYTIVAVPRARKIHQPLTTTPISSLRCLLACLWLLCSSKKGFPSLILANGPATATILVFASVILRFFDWGDTHKTGSMRIVYVESWARVRRLSLSGRLLCRVADRVLVQWEQLDGAYNKAEYIGVLV